MDADEKHQTDSNNVDTEKISSKEDVNDTPAISNDAGTSNENMQEPVKNNHVSNNLPTPGDDRNNQNGADEGSWKGEAEQNTLDYGASLLQESIFYNNEIQVSAELVQSLTEGFTEKFLPSLERNKKTISQIKTSQSVLIETVQHENAKFKDCLALEGLEKTMSRAKTYHGKLVKLRREMTALHEKSAKLKRRALRLQQLKQKDELTRAQQIEDDYEKEKRLTARVAQSPLH